MSDIVSATYERGASFRAWAHESAMERVSIRTQLTEEREALLESIDWQSWDPEASQRLALLDHLLDM
jgi:hypothetical protein